MTVVVRLLGAPSVETDGAPTAPPRGRKSWALLAYLVLSERPPTRQHLAALLFPEADDPLGALRWSLADLRRSSGPVRRGGRGPGPADPRRRGHDRRGAGVERPGAGHDGVGDRGAPRGHGLRRLPGLRDLAARGAPPAGQRLRGPAARGGAPPPGRRPVRTSSRGREPAGHPRPARRELPGPAGPQPDRLGRPAGGARPGGALHQPCSSTSWARPLRPRCGRRPTATSAASSGLRPRRPRSRGGTARGRSGRRRRRRRRRRAGVPPPGGGRSRPPAGTARCGCRRSTRSAAPSSTARGGATRRAPPSSTRRWRAPSRRATRPPPPAPAVSSASSTSRPGAGSAPRSGSTRPRRSPSTTTSWPPSWGCAA